MIHRACNEIRQRGVVGMVGSVFFDVAAANFDGTIRIMRQSNDITPKRETIPNSRLGEIEAAPLLPRVKSSSGKRGRGRPSHPYANARARINTIQLFSFLLSLSRHYFFATRSNSIPLAKTSLNEDQRGEWFLFFFLPFHSSFLPSLNILFWLNR